ncbi:MAG: signal peptidase II [Bdellovibrionales bacterium]
MKWTILLLISGLSIALDQVTKLMIYTNFRLGESVDVINNFFALTYVRNYGAAFGFLSNTPDWFRENFFLIVPPLAMLLILHILRKEVPDDDTWQILAYSSIFGGAIGNYIDRWQHGFVVDFLDFHYKNTWTYPAFNVADMSIVGGVGVLIILMIIETKNGKKPKPPANPGDEKEKPRLRSA